MFSELTWLMVMQLLLNGRALCMAPPPARNTPLLETGARGESEGSAQLASNSFPGSHPQPGLSFNANTNPGSVAAQKEERVQSANHLLGGLGAKLRGKIPNHLHIRGNISCEELLSASTLDDSLPSALPQELLGLSLVPVLVVAGCPGEAQTLVLKLYELLGTADTEELLLEVQRLIERRSSQPPAASATTSSGGEQGGRHIEAAMFNIRQLGTLGEETATEEGHCAGWTRARGTTLAGTAAAGTAGGLEEAVSGCEALGALCAGVTRSGALGPAAYRAVLKKGSRILPSDSSGSESWIRRCGEEEHLSVAAASGGRTKRSPQRSCVNKREERVYNVVEWIPAVSTLYNLGTAVYYASVNCSETAKERALLSAVDLGTDALLVATGGAAGVAGYAVGAGVKTGVKAGVRYLLNSMKQEDDVLVNQFGWEEGVTATQ